MATDRTAAFPAVGRAASRGPAHDDEHRYARVQTMFRELRTLPVESVEHRRLRDEIIGSALPLADHVARRYTRSNESYEDLVQVACVGLLNAVNRYDPDAGDFLAYAVPTVMGEVKRYFRDCGWAVKVPRRLKDVYPRIAPTTAELTQRLGRAPTPSEVAAEMGIDREDLVEGMLAGESYSTRSIDAVIGDGDDGHAMVDRLGALDPNIRFIEDREDLRTHLALLSRREQQILKMRFFESLTQSEIAARVGVSQMHVSRLLAQALTTLRDAMSDSPAPLSRAG